jgi:hypothetical protein
MDEQDWWSGGGTGFLDKYFKISTSDKPAARGSDESPWLGLSPQCGHPERDQEDHHQG